MRVRMLAVTVVAALAAAFVLAVSTTAQAAAHLAARSAHRPSSSGHAILFSSDGMRPDLMQRYAAQGLMPTYRDLMRTGVTGANGLEQGFPPNTGQGWYTLATGAWPGQHGSTNNTFFDTRLPFDQSLSFAFHGNGAVPGSDPTNVLQAQSIASSAEQAGKKVAQIEWTGGLNANIAGPTVDYDSTFSRRGVLAYPRNATEQASAATFGLSYQVAAFTPAAGWSNVPASRRPAMQSTLTVPTTFPTANPDRVFDLYAWAAGGHGYDHLLLVPQAAGKDGGQALARLPVGKFADVKLRGGLTGVQAGQSAGFYVKVTAMAGDLSSFKLYFTSVARANAHCATAACLALYPGLSGEDPLAKYVNDNLPSPVFADFGPEEAHIIDEDTYVQQGLDLNQAYDKAVLRFVLGRLQPDTDLAMVGYDVTDEFSHQFLGLLTKTDPEGRPNPYYDRVAGAGPRDRRLAAREGYLQRAYGGADRRLGWVRSMLPRQTDVMASSDHGFAPQWKAVDAPTALKNAGVETVGQTANCKPAVGDVQVAKACWAGGTAQVYLNVKGRDPDGVVDPADYTAVRNKVMAAFRSITDGSVPNRDIVSTVLTKEQLADVEGSMSLHPTRSGDVVAVLKPPYEFDASTPGTLIAPSQFFGQHGYLPNYVDLRHNINMHATFVAAGPGVTHRRAGVGGVRAVDLAPTLAFLLGVPAPGQSQGRVLTSILSRGPDLVRGRLLAINDLHGNLTGDGLSYTDAYNGTRAPAGGAANLAHRLRAARAADPAGTLLLDAGDSVGASPPESALLRDKPTLDVLNAIGFDAGTLGNHEFDRGVPELLKQVYGGQSTVDKSVTFPRLKFPTVDANVISTRTGKPLLPPYAIEKIHGVRVGIIGATTITTPGITTTGATDGVRFVDEADAINKYVRVLHAQGVHAIVTIVHEGGDQDTFPVGAVSDRIHGIAERLDPDVDVVVSGHSHTTVNTRVGGMLVVQAQSFGEAYDDVALTLDRSRDDIVAESANVVPVWTTTVPSTVDPAAPPAPKDPAVARIVADAQRRTGPIVNRVVNTAAADVPDDAVASGESPAGDMVADAQREFTGADIAMVNSGSIRAGLTAGPVTYGDLFTIQPFADDYMDTVSLTGAQVWTLLREQFQTPYNKIMQVAGMHFRYTSSGPGQGTITGAWLGQVGDDSHPIPDDASATYTVAANSFMVGGGDGFTEFTHATNVTQLAATALDALVDGVGKLPTPFRYAVDGRIALG